MKFAFCYRGVNSKLQIPKFPQKGLAAKSSRFRDQGPTSSEPGRMAVYEIPLTFAPALELEERTTFRHRAVTFGDGYEQRSGAGINPKIRTVSPRFPALTTERKNELIGILDNVAATHLIKFAVPGDTVYSQWWLDGPYTIKRISVMRWEVSFTLRLFITTAEPVPTVVPNL